MAGDAIAARALAEHARYLADEIADRFDPRQCRVYLEWAQVMRHAGRTMRGDDVALKIMPPITIDDAEMDRGCAILAEVCGDAM